MRAPLIHALGAAEAVLRLQAEQIERDAHGCSPGLLRLSLVTAEELRRHASELRQHRETEGCEDLRPVRRRTA